MVTSAIVARLSDRFWDSAHLANRSRTAGALAARKTDDARKETLLALEITRKLAAREDATADELYAYALTMLDCQPPDLRSPAAALQLAQRSSAKSNAPDRDILELIARAYFATGDRERAIETEQMASTL